MDPQPQGGWIVTAQNLVESDIGVAKNWLSDKGDILFHFNPRPDERHIAMNSYINGSWGTEDRVPLEYDNSSMKNAKWIITVDDRGFRVVDGTSNKLVHVFAHRVQMRMDAWNAPPPALNATSGMVSQSQKKQVESTAPLAAHMEPLPPSQQQQQDVQEVQDLRRQVEVLRMEAEAEKRRHAEALAALKARYLRACYYLKRACY